MGVGLGGGSTVLTMHSIRPFETTLIILIKYLLPIVPIVVVINCRLAIYRMGGSSRNVQNSISRVCKFSTDRDTGIAMGGEEVDEPIDPAVEVGMVVLIEDLSAREQQLMKPTVIAHRLLRTHTQPACSGRTPAARPPPTRNRWGSPVPGRAPDAEPPERHRQAACTLPSPTAGFGRPSQSTGRAGPSARVDRVLALSR